MFSPPKEAAIIPKKTRLGAQEDASINKFTLPQLVDPKKSDDDDILSNPTT